MNRLCDTHVHVFDPGRFPYASARKFTPDTANTQQLQIHLETIGANSVVLVQPSVYGTDHRCLLDALETLGSTARGIAVIDQTTSPDQIKALDRAGVVGARINMVVNHHVGGDFALDAVRHLESHTPSHWHIQLHVHLHTLDALADHLRYSSRHFVLDHLGLPDIQQGVHSPAWQRLLDIVRTGRLYVKASAPYLSSAQSSAYGDLKPFIQSLIDAHPQRLLWGSNWPHTQGTRRDASTPLTHIETFRHEDDVSWRNQCVAWSAEQQTQFGYSNAHALYFA